MKCLSGGKSLVARGYASQSPVRAERARAGRAAYEPSLFPMVEGDAFRVVSPVLLSFHIDRQETGRYRLAGVLTGEKSSWPAAGVSSSFTWPVATSF